MDAFLEALLGDTPIERIIIGLLMLGFIAVSRLLLAEKDKRITDAGKTFDNIATPMKQIQESISRMEGKIVISKRAEQNEASE